MMKTIDEVIKACEETVSDVDRGVDIEGCYLGATETRDALHYLKEFKRISAKLEKIALGNITETLEKLDNPALTWDELKSMEGKPVWLESHGDISEFTGWAIVSNVLEDRMRFIFSHYDGDFLTYEMSLPDCTFNSGWQAYRKERN